ncbi:MAG: glycosyltransferase family 9 protein [Flavobacteriales bacterium]|nr:glycosyltransferase family 9 protein [Bacteroidota bacterium]MCB9239914.1 glycosyltransferase family 9 protein [Flavobacteriales bacterium]
MKVLVIRFSSIGDIVLTTPVVRCLKNQLNAEVHYLTKPGFSSLLANNPYVDQVWTLDSPNLREELKRAGFTLVVDLHNNLRSRKITSGLRTDIRRFNKINIAKWLVVNKLSRSLPEWHIVDRYLQTVEHLSVKNDGKGLDYFPAPDANLKNHSIPNSPFAVYAIGGQWQTKQLPNDLISDLCAKIEHPIVLIGGKDDATVGDQLEQNHSHVINLCGKLSLDQSALVTRQSSLLISHDTGMMHIGSAFGVDVFSIWGNTIPEFGMYPYQAGEQSIQFEVPNLGCRPCSKIGFNQCPNSHFHCMRHQNMDRIASEVNLLLRRKDDGK